MRAPFVVAVAVVAGLAGVAAGQLDELGAQGRQDDAAIDLADARLVDLQPSVQLEDDLLADRAAASS